MMKAIDDTREAVQSSALHLLVLLTDEKGVGQASVEVASFVAFQDGFHVLLRVMTQEKLATDNWKLEKLLLMKSSHRLGSKHKK